MNVAKIIKQDKIDDFQAIFNDVTVWKNWNYQAIVKLNLRRAKEDVEEFIQVSTLNLSLLHLGPFIKDVIN